MTTVSKQAKVEWTVLLQDAVNKPGIISKAYSTFYNYSIGNQLLAYLQCANRGIEIGAIATYKKWTELGRQVKKGEKAISLYIPSQFKVKEKNSKGEDVERVIKYFAFKPNWFVLGQTEGDAFAQEIKTPQWDANLALQNLGVTEEAFAYANGNTQGYAKPADKIIAINPVAQYKHKTRFHELAHVVLHGKEAQGLFSHGDALPKDIKEVEAESVAYILISLLNLPGQEESRGYIQNWLGGNDIGEKQATRIFGAVEKIFKAGNVVAI